MRRGGGREARYNVANDEAIAHAFQEELLKLPNTVESDDDEAIAHAFQEELSKLPDIVESDDGSSRAAVLNQNWRDHSSSAREETSSGAMARGSSSTARRTDPYPYADYDDSDQYGADEDDFKLALALSTSEEEQITKRLTQLDSIRHVPRINVDELPTVHDASLDHARLTERLFQYGLKERPIQGDGNCQFRALSDQLYGTPEHHKFVRDQVVSQLEDNADEYSGYVTMQYSEYLEKMAKNGEWGDHVTLQAAADCYGVKICLITSFKDDATSFIEILPRGSKSNRVIYLSFWAEVHYNSISVEGSEDS